VSTVVLAGKHVREDDAPEHDRRKAPVKKKYVVDLDKHERKRLREMVQKGQSGARRLRRAHTLLLADEGRTDEEIARALHAGVRTVERTRRRFVEEGLEAALSERPRSGGALRRKLDGHREAYLVALACSDPPEGRERWTMQLLAEKLVEVGLVEEICDETVRRTLKKGASSRG
jgi:transposase